MNEEAMKTAVKKVQDSQRAMFRLMTVFILDDDISGYYSTLFEEAPRIVQLVTSLMCALEACVRAIAEERGLTIGEQLQTMALQYESFGEEAALEYLQWLSEGKSDGC